MFKGLQVCTKAISSDPHLSGSFLPPGQECFSTRGEALPGTFLSQYCFEALKDKQCLIVQAICSVCVCHSEGPVQRAQSYTRTSQGTASYLLLLCKWRYCPQAHYVIHPMGWFCLLHPRTWGCFGACCVSFGNKALFSFLPSLIPSFSNRLQSHSLPHWGSALCSNTLVFVHQNKQIIILGWTDRKSGFIFSFF